MNFSSILSFVQGSSLTDILTACLTIVGALRTIAEFTPLKADDHVFDSITGFFQKAEDYAQKARGLLSGGSK